MDIEGGWDLLTCLKAFTTTIELEGLDFDGATAQSGYNIGNVEKK